LSAIGARLAATAEPSSVIGALLAAAAATPEPDDHRPFWMVGRFRSSRRDNSRHAHKRNTFFLLPSLLISFFYYFLFCSVYARITLTKYHLSALSKNKN
jgi:hypothetical protein